MTETITSFVTDPHKKQTKRFAEDAIDRAFIELDLDRDSLQRMIEHGDDFQSDIIASIKRHSISNLYANEEVQSNYNYPPGYAPKPLEEQISILRGYWPKLNPGSCTIELERQSLVMGAEASFAIPYWQVLAGIYNEAFEKEMLEAIKQSRNGKLKNWREGELGPDRLRQSQRSMKFWQQIMEQQRSDILIIFAQFGIRHRGRSVRRARALFTANEFGLGAFAVGSMVLTHPLRLQRFDELDIDCSGDEYSPRAGGDFDRAPIFNFSDDGAHFRARLVGGASGDSGSASGLLPQ